MKALRRTAVQSMFVVAAALVGVTTAEAGVSCHKINAKGAGQDADAVNKRFAEARQLLEKIIGLSGERATAEAYLGLGDAQLGMGELDAALTTWRGGLKKFHRSSTLIQISFQGRIVYDCVHCAVQDERKLTDESANNAGDHIVRRREIKIEQYRAIKMFWDFTRDSPELV